ncbi:MAG: TonB-dependent receptor [Rubrivivax sp.]|nr:MAG: TonB-dependent receptor [Rubrivivax sp.]
MHFNSRPALALMVLLSPAVVLAQVAKEGQSAQELDTVVISTGTRTSGLKAIDSPAPIQVLDGSVVQRTGQPDLVQALSQFLPSFTADAKGGDASALTVAARLRGLSPNHTLVLIDGKRRHGTANVNVSAGAFRGGAAPDLSLIPASAIERIEVLQDGAAAQYGSDAIAGVINIILKKNDAGGGITVDSGRYFDGDGQTNHGSVNIGLKPAEGAFLNFSADVKSRQHSDRSDVDSRFVPPYLTGGNANVVNVPGYPYVNHTYGDPGIEQQLLSLNAGVDLGGGRQLYSLFTAAHKYAEAIQNYRGPASAPAIYPLGYSPIEAHDEDDTGFTVGLKGQAFAGWAYDLSSTYGRNRAKVLNLASVNVNLLNATGSSPTNFYEGYLRAKQVTTTLDVNRDFNVGWASPLNVALGVEHRRDSYAIGEGDATSTVLGGAEAFPGYTRNDAGNHARHSEALYVDVAGSLTEKLQLDAAVRTEHFSDFGGATVGKLTGRYEVWPTLALRGTVSSGFRAPTLAEEYYSATKVSPSDATVQLPSYAPAAALLGIDKIKPEKSHNLSLGFVAKPSARFTTSLDVYQIEITDRILQSGNLIGQSGATIRSQAVIDAIVANGNVLPANLTTKQLSLFSNAADTRNRGADLVLTYADAYGGWGKVDWSAGANYNEVKVTRLSPTPAQLNGQLIQDAAARSYLEKASPKYRLNLGALWRVGAWSVNLRENIYGPSSFLASLNNITYFENRLGTQFITDLDVNYRFNKQWSVSVGANNLFNVYPDPLNPDYRAALRNRTPSPSQDVQKYASFSPIGINGGFYYAKANFNF